MELNKICLMADKTIPVLSGNQYGVSLYNQQVKDKFREDRKNVIVFPENIDDIAVSFIQGFFKDIVDRIGPDSFADYVEIESSHEDVVKKIYDNIY